jgi:hypothetical protein
VAKPKIRCVYLPRDQAISRCVCTKTRIAFRGKGLTEDMEVVARPEPIGQAYPPQTDRWYAPLKKRGRKFTASLQILFGGKACRGCRPIPVGRYPIRIVVQDPVNHVAATPLIIYLTVTE